LAIDFFWRGLVCAVPLLGQTALPQGVCRCEIRAAAARRLSLCGV